LRLSFEISLDVGLVDSLPHDPELGLFIHGRPLILEMQYREDVFITEPLAYPPFLDLGLIDLGPSDETCKLCVDASHG
jgi:hypothetical protein